MGEIIRDLPHSSKPICPHALTPPIHETHQLRARILDGFYNAAEKDTDGEMTEPMQQAHTAAGEAVDDRMDLYWHAVGFSRGRERVRVETYYFRCHTCGFVLPANLMNRLL